MDSTNEEFVRIKKSNTLTPWFALVAFALAAASIYCLLVPLVIYRVDNRVLYYLFLVVGAVGTLYFTGLFAYMIAQLFSPKNAMLVSSEGFLDLLNGTDGAGFIPWGNVAKLEMTGGEKPLIIIGLLDADAVPNIKDAKLSKQLNEGSPVMPELFVKPYEIAIPLKKAFLILREARDSYYRESAASGETAILSDTVTRTIRQPAISKAAPKKEEPPKPDDEKSVDELLKELSGEIEKRRQKLANDNKKSSEEIEDIIKYVKGKE